jgi:hypothetical protein
MKLNALLLSLCFCLGNAAYAQNPAPAPRQGSRIATPAPPPAAPPAVVDPSAGGQLVNIRLDLSVLDQVGTAPPAPKTLTVLLADRQLSQVRSIFDDRTLNVDARPTIIDGHIRVSLTIDTTKVASPNAFVGPGRQSITCILESGKSLVVLESADPATNRKMTIEVKATILK